MVDEATMELWCAVVDKGHVFSVQVKPSATVQDLKRQLKTEQPEIVTCGAAQLKLYLAKDGGTWLSSNHPDAKALRRGEITNSIAGRLSEDIRMDETATIQESIVEAGLSTDLLTRRIHVLVQLPESQDAAAGGVLKRQKIGSEAFVVSLASKEEKMVVPQWKWKDEVDPVYSLQKLQMFFVNRSNAIEQLQNIHEANHSRAVLRKGDEWIIPLADNVIGLGKSAFGAHYIRKCRETWWNADARSDFQKTLCDSRTVHIVFRQGNLVTNKIDDVVINLLVESLLDMFDEPPRILANHPDSASHFIADLTKEVGPLFIVLDEIGAAFDCDSLNDIQRREHFMFFCKRILGNWFSLKKVFFLVLGRGSFLSYVGLRPEPCGRVPSSPCEFERLSLHLLRPSAIQEIMMNTRLTEDANSKTIKDACGLDDSEVEQVANHLFKERLKRLLKQMEGGASVNLSQEVLDNGGKTVPLDIIASDCCIAWEGTLNDAKLYIPPFIERIIEQYVLPLRDYIGRIARAMARGVSIDYPTVFEWVCLKRFQEMFAEEARPKDVLREFFNATWFGDLRGVKFADGTGVIPKITSNGHKGQVTDRLQSLTATPEEWPSLLKEINALLEQGESVCLKPRQKSSSSDAFLFAKLTPAISADKPIFLTVGLAIKNYKSASFSQDELYRECEVFDRMFMKQDMTNRKNVLIVCATKYDTSFSDVFRGNKSGVYHAPEKFKRINEVILLDLSSSTNRCAFFGFTANDPLTESLNAVIQKAEVELKPRVPDDVHAP